MNYFKFSLSLILLGKNIALTKVNKINSGDDEILLYNWVVSEVGSLFGVPSAEYLLNEQTK